MRLKLSFLGIEAKIAGLLVVETVIVSPLLLCMIFYFPGCLLFLRYFEGGQYLKPILGFMLVLALVVVWKKWRLGSDEPEFDEPLRREANAFPDLERLLTKVESEMRCAIPRRAAVVLSPVLWRTFGCDPARLRDRRDEV